MGKIRVKTLGNEETEKKQQQKADKRSDAKKFAKEQVEAVETVLSDVQKTGTTVLNETNAASTQETTQDKKQKKKKFVKSKKSPRSSKYLAVASKIDRKKTYSLKEALSILPDLQTTKFDETVELHINTTEQGVSGSMQLPHGTGKKTRVVTVNQTEDPKAVEDLIKNVEAGKIEFDILIATPDSMPKLARIAKFLGPRGLMPNPKNGTITPKPLEAAKKFEGGQMNFKTEAKAPIIHITVGKMSFGEEKLTDNIKTVLGAIDSLKIRNVTLKSTMSPGIKLSVTN